MKSKWFKLLSVIIIAVLVFHASAQTVYGVIEIIPNENKKGKETVILDSKNESFFVDSENEEESKILYEDVSKREQNIKHFLTEGGTFQAVIYPSSVHYELDGKWEDIDNTLITTKNENGEEITRNNKNSFTVEFSNNIKEDILSRRDVLNEQKKSVEQEIMNEQEELIKQDNLEEQNDLNKQDELVEELLNEQEEIDEEDKLNEQNNLIEENELNKQDSLNTEELEEQEELIEKEEPKEEEILNEEVVQIEKTDKRKSIIIHITILTISMEHHIYGFTMHRSNKI